MDEKTLELSRFDETFRAKLIEVLEIIEETAINAPTLNYSMSTVLSATSETPLDWNTLTNAGNYTVETRRLFANMTHTPYDANEGNAGAGRLFVMTTINANRFLQLYVESNRMNNIYKRYYYGTDWTDWTRLATIDELASIFTTIAKLSNDVTTLSAENLLMKRPAETVTSAGMTFASDGNGNYTIVGSQQGQGATGIYSIYQSETTLPDGIIPNHRYKLIVAMDVQIQLQVRFYNGSSWAMALSTTNDAYFTVPSDAVGMAVRFAAAYGTKYTTNVAPSTVHPEIVEVGSVGYLMPEEKAPIKMLTIIDDDGNSKFYTELLPIIQAKHVPITSAVICQRINDHVRYPAYMTWDQVQECYLAGADIVSHTYAHITPETVISDDLTVEQLTEDYQKAYNDLSVHGIISPSLVFNNDSGKYGKQQQAAKTVYDYAFTNQNTAISSIGEVINHRETTARYNILREDITPTTAAVKSLDDMKSMIDTLVTAEEGWLVWMTHTSSSQWPIDGSESAKLASAIDYALSQGVKIVSCATGIKYIFG